MPAIIANGIDKIKITTKAWRILSKIATNSIPMIITTKTGNNSTNPPKIKKRPVELSVDSAIVEKLTFDKPEIFRAFAKSSNNKNNPRPAIFDKSIASCDKIIERLIKIIATISFGNIFLIL